MTSPPSAICSCFRAFTSKISTVFGQQFFRILSVKPPSSTSLHSNPKPWSCATSLLCSRLAADRSLEMTGGPDQRMLKITADPSETYSPSCGRYCLCVPPSGGEIVAVLGALNECDSKSIAETLRNLNEFCPPAQIRCSTPLNFLITSRLCANLSIGFRKLAPIAAYIHINSDNLSSSPLISTMLTPRSTNCRP